MARMDKWIAQSQPVWDKEDTPPPRDAAYFHCLVCNTVERWEHVPQHLGQDMMPWHIHGSTKTALQRVYRDTLFDLAKNGATFAFDVRAMSAHDFRKARRQAGDEVPTPPAIGSSRLKALMAKLAQEGW